MSYIKNRILKKYPINILSKHLITYRTPINLNYLWGFGSLAGLCLLIQIVSGILLAMHYTPHVLYAFDSVEHILRDVKGGFYIKHTHANGASMFFIVVYLHIARGIYFNSYSRSQAALWVSGVIIFILMMATAFLGYVLPWGQMSFWGATVITNLFTAIPIVGEDIAYWLWGGFSVDNATLNRFFSLHYLLPFLITGLVLLHLVLLHSIGSSNPLGVHSTCDKVNFYPYFYLKDLLGFWVFISVFTYLVCFEPNLLGHPDNYIPANPLVTPAHIVPEWYFLPFYAILRSIPDKLGGVLFMGGALLALLVLPWVANPLTKNPRNRFLYQFSFWLFACDVIFLGWLGAKPVAYPYVFYGQCATFYYFFFLLILVPFLSRYFDRAVYKSKLNPSYGFYLRKEGSRSTKKKTLKRSVKPFAKKRGR